MGNIYIGMDPCLVLSSIQKANRFTKHNMKKSMTLPKLRETDDKNKTVQRMDTWQSRFSDIRDNPCLGWNSSNKKFRESKSMAVGREIYFGCISTIIRNAMVHVMKRCMRSL